MAVLHLHFFFSFLQRVITEKREERLGIGNATTSGTTLK